MPPSITLIVALAENRVIGRASRLPWHLPEDLRRFKQLTLGHPMLMGRRCWESLPGLLPGRRHIVMSRSPNYRAEGCEVVHSLEEGISLAGNAGELMVIGGAEIYRLALPLANRMKLTQVHAKVEGEVWFPEFDPAEWREVSRELHRADSRHAWPFSFVTLERITETDAWLKTPFSPRE